MSSTRFLRSGCTHGSDEAYARIYGIFKRQLSRVSVRAAMLVLKFCVVLLIIDTYPAAAAAARRSSLV